MLKIIIIRLYIKLFIRIGVDGLQIKFLHHVGLIPACLVAKYVITRKANKSFDFVVFGFLVII